MYVCMYVCMYVLSICKEDLPCFAVNPVVPADTVVTAIACGGYHSTHTFIHTYIHLYTRL